MRRAGLKFVVTGTGRSGTQYASELFKTAGLRCGHEAYFKTMPGPGELGPVRSDRLRHIRVPIGRLREHRRRRALDLEGDASWMAAPRLEKFEGLVFLQLRHPAKVARSLLQKHFFTDSTNPRPHQKYALRFFTPTDDPIDDVLRFWLFWNEMAAERAHLIYAVEALDAELFAGILDRLDVANPTAKAAQALGAVPKTVNAARQPRTKPLRWADFPDTETKQRVAAAAERWGYDVTDQEHVPTM